MISDASVRFKGTKHTIEIRYHGNNVEKNTQKHTFHTAKTELCYYSKSIAKLANYKLIYSVNYYNRIKMYQSLNLNYL